MHTLLYHVSVHRLAERALAHIRQQELVDPGDRVGVAVSGGIDSVALLRLLLELRRELGVVVSVVHFNHKLRGPESDSDQEFVAALASAYDLEFFSDTDEVAQHATDEHLSVETAARELRYGFFHYLLGADGSDSSRRAPQQPGAGAPAGTGEQFLTKVATGHTLNDQAETVLMRLIRGSGMRGLGGIHPRLAVSDDNDEICGEIVRPLLAIRRGELAQYLTDIAQGWHEDSSNADNRFTRNRVRNLVLPLLEKEFNPALAENLADLSEIARGEEDYWEGEVSGWLGTTVQWAEPDWAPNAASRPNLVQIGVTGGAAGNDSDLRARIQSAPWLVMNASVSRVWFLGEALAVQRRIVKAIGEHAGIALDFKHVEEILRFAAEGKARLKQLSLPKGWKLVLEPDELLFLTPDLREPQNGSGGDYEYELTVPGRIGVVEAGLVVEAKPIGLAREEAGYNPEHLLDAQSLPGSLRVRNWHPGDRFWPAHTKSPKKIKELLQEQHVAPPERRLWPILCSGDEIVWVRGYRCAEKFQARPGREAILIATRPIRDELPIEHPGSG